MSVDISPAMIRWAQTADYDVTLGSRALDGRSVLYNRGGELRIFVGLRPDGWIAVTESERMGAEQLAFAATSMAVVERWLLSYFGSSVRAARKLPRLQCLREIRPFATGYGVAEVSFDGRTRSCLVGPDGELVALSVASEPVATSELIEMSHLVAVPFTTITQAFFDDMASGDLINAAIVWSMANGSPMGSPIISRENMVEHYGSERADELITEIRRLLQELMAIPVDWNRQSWQEAGDYVRDCMKARHPFLSEPAAARLRGYFMYQTK